MLSTVKYVKKTHYAVLSPWSVSVPTGILRVLGSPVVKTKPETKTYSTLFKLAYSKIIWLFLFFFNNTYYHLTGLVFGNAVANTIAALIDLGGIFDSLQQSSCKACGCSLLFHPSLLSLPPQEVPCRPSRLLFSECSDFAEYLPYELRIIQLQKRGTSESCPTPAVRAGRFRPRPFGSPSSRFERHPAYKSKQTR